jgi:hypothetical protein
MTTQQELSSAFDTHAAALQQVSNSTPVPEAVSRFLGQLGLLEGVPFEHLVPDSRMLPPESIRFFYLDNNWVHSLVDGALSIGIHSDRDIRFHAVMQHVIRKVADVAAGNLRSEALAEAAGIAAAANASSANLNLDPRRRAGFMMRSGAVSGWPGLEVRGFTGPDENQEVKMLRLVRLAPDVLLAIFEDVPGMISFKEPDEDLHFGIRGGSIEVRDPEILASAPIVSPPANASPVALAGIDPNRAAARPSSGAQQDIILSGAGFAATARVIWQPAQGSPVELAVLSRAGATRIDARIPASLLTRGGLATVLVRNSGQPDSPARPFTITAAAAVNFRQNSTAAGVVDIRKLAQDLRPIIPGAGATLGAALFAIQMVDPPDQKQFVPGAGV